MLSLIFLLAWDGARPSVQLASFERVWAIIQEKHWDLPATGVNWQAVHQEFRPRAEAMEDPAAMRALIEEMIGRLGQTHFGMLGGHSFATLDALKARVQAGSSDLGIEVRAVQGGLFVTRIDAAGEGFQGGLRLGSEILAIQELEAGTILAAVEEAFAGSLQRSLYITRALNEFVHHQLGQQVRYRVRLPKEPADRLLVFANRQETPLQQFFPNMPPMHYAFTRQQLSDGVGYLSFNLFLQPLMQDFPQALREFHDAKGLIIDLRGNPGGLGMLANGLAGYLIGERGKKLGTMRAREGTLNFIVLPRGERYEGPVALLLDEASASTSEILAQGLKDLGRARIFGSRSAGAALPSFIETLPNGDRFQYAFGDFTSTGGVAIEGRGVEPDQPEPHSKTTLRTGQDAALQAALRWIHSQNQP